MKRNKPRRLSLSGLTADQAKCTFSEMNPPRPEPTTRYVPQERVLERIALENPWWRTPHTVAAFYRSLRPRAYFASFNARVTQAVPRRATVLMGPRRVGKTVMIHHAIQSLLDAGTPPSHILYVSVDHPMYNGLGLEDLLHLYCEGQGVDPRGQLHLFFDEVQYLRDWEVHLKALFDGFPALHLVISGSAAAALRLKSVESGAGRFTDFLLPPLTFHEYLELTGSGDLVEQREDADAEFTFECEDIEELNERFIEYLNYGGYPEVAMTPAVRADTDRYVQSDIIDKVLLRDLPSLYGIRDIQELNSLFMVLAYNTSNEVSLSTLSKDSGVTKPTIKRYIEYLEAAFLLRRVERVDRNAKRFKRAMSFKIYLTNPSIWSALFTPVDAKDTGTIGSLAETAVFAQWFHSPTPPHYARWDKGEIDLVGLYGNQRPSWALEVKWSDGAAKHPGKLSQAIDFCHANNLDELTVTTRTRRGGVLLESVLVEFYPTALYCYTAGRNAVTGLSPEVVKERRTAKLKALRERLRRRPPGSES